MKNLGAGGRGESVVVWATTESLGVYRSTDGGRTWTRIRTPSPQAEVAGVDPRDGNRAFLMFLPPESGPAAPSGLFLTTDGGATWTRTLKELPLHSYVYQVAFDPRDEDVLFAATTAGLYRSEDGGQSWSLAGTITSNVFAVAVAPDDPDLLLISTLDRAYRSTDGGATFTQVFGSGLAGLVFDPSDPDRVYGTFGTLYRSTDRGLTWQRIGRPFGVNHYTLTVDRDGTLYTGSDVGVIRSTNGGTTFTPRASFARRFPDDAIGDVIALSNGDVLAAGRRGVWRLPDGAERWQASSRGIRALVISGVGVAGDGRVLASVPGNGVFYSDNGVSFRVSNRGLLDPSGGVYGLEEIVAAPSDPDVLYGSVSGQFFRSDNGGVTWRELTDARAGRLVRIVGVDPTDPDVVYAGGPEYHPRDDYYLCHALRSRDGGATWTCLQDDDIYQIGDVVIDPARPRRLLALDGGRFVVSDDQGNTWRPSGRGLPTDRRIYPSIARDGRGRLFIVTDHGQVYRSDNGGASFALVSRGLPAGGKLVADPRHPDTLYAFVPLAGVFRSRDGGLTWQHLGTGLPAGLFFGAAALDAERGILWAGTRGRGLYRIDVD